MIIFIWKIKLEEKFIKFYFEKENKIFDNLYQTKIKSGNKFYLLVELKNNLKIENIKEIPYQRFSKISKEKISNLGFPLNENIEIRGKKYFIVPLNAETDSIDKLIIKIKYSKNNEEEIIAMPLAKK
ncbi:MAG: hypothetical protein ACRCSK_08135 [Fusobacteriaceae bacterium]